MNIETRQVILIVDDNITNLKVAVENLKAHKLDVITARSGEAGLERARFARPDLILLDIDLPGIDGFEACRRIKADSATRDIPVIFMTALADVEDKVRGFAAGGVDYITKPIQVEELHARVDTHLTIRRLQQSLEERIKELDAFAHTVAHDLKNPLAAVIGYVQFIESLNMGALPEQARMALAVISQNSYKMSSIIDELLTLASVRNLNDIATGPLMMGRIINDTMTRLSRIVDTSDAKIVLPQRWPVAHGYGPWIEEVWANYISNAIKYGGTPPQIELGADRLAGDDQQPYIRFWIRDNGRGMTAAESGQLFQEFSRLDRHRSLQGHGLGLSIVQRIVQKLGGSVGVESTLGSGSTFSFTLPAAEHTVVPNDAIQDTPAALPQPGLDIAQRRPLRMLVVDDNPTNRELLVLSLAQYGQHADSASNGLEAVAACARQTYDVIFMDVEMAEMDGIKATQQIRRRSGAGPRPRIIACTANSSPVIKEQCLAAGMDDFVNKPVQPHVLAGIMHNGVVQPGSGLGGIGGAMQTDTPSRSISATQALLDPKALDKLRTMVGGETAMLAMVIESFLEDSPRLMAVLRQAAAQGNGQALYLAAHTLKSLGDNFGATTFAQICREIERSGQAGSLDSVAKHLPHLEQAYVQLTSALVSLQQEQMA
jgi:two-component system sensor histidine kinase/response regulator